MADWYGNSRKGKGRGSFGGYNISSRSSSKDEDFEEGDVWAVVYEKEGSLSPKMRKYPNNSYNSSSSSSSSSAWHFTNSSTPRITTSPPARNEGKLVQQSSAPVNIPDWSKIYGKERNGGRVVGSTCVDNNHVEDDDIHYHDGEVHYGNCDGSGEEEEDEDMVPPHEWLAKRLARSQISSFSVCEGIGRTLKGRDLSKVRNAVLSKTGFLE